MKKLLVMLMACSLLLTNYGCSSKKDGEAITVEKEETKEVNVDETEEITTEQEDIDIQDLINTEPLKTEILDETLFENPKGIETIKLSIEKPDNTDTKKDSAQVSQNGKIMKTETGSIYDLAYQEEVEIAIEEEKISGDYTIDNPLAIVNPYGTSTTSLYLYFETEQEGQLEYTVRINDDKSQDFTRIMLNDGTNNMSKTHEYSLIGIVPGCKNIIALRLLDKEGNVLEQSSFSIESGDFLVDTAPKIEMVQGESNNALANGLYALLGHDKAFESNIYMYDNNANIRAEIVLDSYRTDKIEFVDDYMLYSYANNRFAFVNKLGKVEKIYGFEGYEMHHDFSYDKSHNSIITLVNEVGAETVEDLVLILNLDTEEVKIIDMKDHLKECYESATWPTEDDGSKSETLDWIHMNTVDINSNGDIALSARENSAIIVMENIYDTPKIKYIIHGGSYFEDTEYEDLLLEKVGEFVPQAGQHTTTFVWNSGLPEGQYYMHLYNNNYASSKTIPGFDWSLYPGVGGFTKGDHSMYYCYLIDENKKTYELEKMIEVPYSSIVSSTQQVGNNYVTSSGMAHCYNEYDKDGVMIAQFNYDSKKYAYRVFKYSFEGFWYAPY